MRILKDIIDQIERQMSGLNYAITLGVAELGKCKDLDAIKASIKKTFPDSDAFNVELNETTEQDFWSILNDTFAYRGDEGSGLDLTIQEEEQLSAIQNEFKNALKERFLNNPKVYSYPDETGIPGNPVFWDYRFVICTVNNECIFVFASASD